MKKAIEIAVLATAILSLTGCADSDKPQITEPTSAKETASSIVETTAPDESPYVSFSDSKENPEETAAADNSETVQTEVVPPATKESSKAESQPPPPATQSESKQSEPPKSVVPETPSSKQEIQPTEKSQTVKPPQEITPPSEEKPAAPDFNIQTWINYAAGYAEKVRLNVSPDAIDCWDNPIAAGSHSTCLKRDIESRLNRYSRDEEITDVWIWAEERSDGSYDLYIGYA